MAMDEYVLVTSDFAHEAINPRAEKYIELKDGDDWSPALAQVRLDAIAQRLPVFFGYSTEVYEISEAFNHSNIFSIGFPEFRPGGFITEGVISAGSIGEFIALDANANKYSNKLVSALLASAVTVGDWLRIASDADFSNTEPGLKQGEIVTVRQVVGSSIYLNEILMDTYLGVNGAKAAIITMAKTGVEGVIKVVHSPAAETTQTRGVKFEYTHLRGRTHIELDKCRGNGAAFVNCWKPDVRVDVQDGNATGAGVAGYGISIQDCTMYGIFRSGKMVARSAVNGSGVNNASGGPSWENHVVDIVGTTHGSVSTFGCHSNVGSIYFEGCTALGGTDVYDRDEVLIEASGFQSGARRTYYKDCTAIGVATAVALRGESVGTPDREEFVVENFHLIDCVIGFNKGGNTGHLDRLIVHGMTGTLRDLTSHAINILTGDIDEWSFRGVDVSGGGLINIADGLVDLPPRCSLNESSCLGDGVTADGDIRGIYVGSDVEMDLSNVKIEDMYWGIMQGRACEFTLNNVQLLGNLQHINPNGFPMTLSMRNWVARGARHGDANGGVVAAGAGTTIDVLHIGEGEVDTDPYIVGGPVSNVVTTAIIGTIKSHAGYLGHIRGAASPLIFVLSGSRESAFALAGYGDPNGVVTARRGCVFTRLDVAAPGSRVYVNTDGLTAWTAYA